jgi:hypothetical protein
MPKKTGGTGKKVTGDAAARAASKVLRDPKSTKAQRTAAASALVQKERK